ncbi:hypothetical protein F2P81_023456 [Scophthalmus maximus]|uniref:Uncharacterized protein n=1 Tax=Scophthalmus maximus TaxID=52904 RepID=A0A6A4S294_SCOMX|nr:hypothetical protein F2P81_023456 [Scophthalmus maximus]
MEVAAAPCNPSTVQSRARNYWISLKYTDEHQWEVLFGKTIEIEFGIGAFCICLHLSTSTFILCRVVSTVFSAKVTAIIKGNGYQRCGSMVMDDLGFDAAKSHPEEPERCLFQQKASLFPECWSTSLRLYFTS